MAFRCLGYAQHSGALPSGFVGEAFDSGISHSLEGKKREGAPGALFILPRLKPESLPVEQGRAARVVRERAATNTQSGGSIAVRVKASV